MTVSERELLKGIESLTDGEKLSIVLCVGALRYGGNWGFIRRDKRTYHGELELLKQVRNHIKVFRLYNGALVLADENFLINNVNKVVPGGINENYVTLANKRRAEEQDKFMRFLERVLAGKSKFIRNKDGYYEVNIGVFSLNDTNLIRVNGIDYPAYKLTLIEVLDYALRLINLTGKNIYVRAVTDNGQEVFDLVNNLTDSKGLASIYRGLEIADSNTGAFLTLRMV